MMVFIPMTSWNPPDLLLVRPAPGKDYQEVAAETADDCCEDEEEAPETQKIRGLITR